MGVHQGSVSGSSGICWRSIRGPSGSVRGPVGGLAVGVRRGLLWSVGVCPGSLWDLSGSTPIFFLEYVVGLNASGVCKKSFGQ